MRFLTVLVLFAIGLPAADTLLVKSVDAGKTWQRLGAIPAASDPRLMTPHPVNPGLMFTSTADGIEKSEDGGMTWTAVAEHCLQAQYPFRLVVDPNAPDTFYLVNWMRQQLRLEP